MPVMDKKIKIADFEEKVWEIEVPKIPELKDEKVIDVANLSAMICSDILPVIATYSKSGNEDDCVAIEIPESRFQPNHTIEVAA